MIEEMLRTDVNKLKNGFGYDKLQSLMNLLDSDDDGIISIARPILGNIQKKLIQEIKEELKEKDKEAEEYFNLMHALVILGFEVTGIRDCNKDNDMFLVAYIPATFDDGTEKAYESYKNLTIRIATSFKNENKQH